MDPQILRLMRRIPALQLRMSLIFVNNFRYNLAHHLIISSLTPVKQCLLKDELKQWTLEHNIIVAATNKQRSKEGERI
jgi:hypothetical protein